MKGIELEIILDKPEKTYSYGEKIKGEVKAIVHEEWQCDALGLFLGVKGFSEVKEGGKKFKLTVTDDKEKKYSIKACGVPAHTPILLKLMCLPVLLLIRATLLI